MDVGDRGHGLGRFFYPGSTDSYKVRQQSRITQELGGGCSLKGVKFCPLPPGTEGARSHFSVVTDSVAMTPWNQ